MIIDTSAVVACLAAEPGAEPLKAAILTAGECRMSAFSVCESRVVLGRKYGDPMLRELDLFLVKAQVEVDAFDEEQASLAHQAYLRFGKATGHRAGLNLGDCASYALAVSRGLPLLYKGDDFAATDVRSASTAG